MTSPALAEALREEIRRTLDNDGKPFTPVVARRVYDIAIAAKDFMIAAAGKSTADTIAAIEDVGGPIEDITPSGASPAHPLVAETFGARMMRELLAIIPMLKPAEDPKKLVLAIAEARRTGLNDIADQLQLKLLGHEAPLLGELIGASPEAPVDFNPSPPQIDQPRCQEKNQCADLDGSGACKGCGRWLGDERPEGSAMAESGPKFSRPLSGMENAFDPGVTS